MKPLIFSLLILNMARCSSGNYLSPKELNKFILNPDHGLIQQTEINGYTVEVHNKPTDLWVEQELGKDIMDPAKIKSFRDKYKSYYYFILDLSKNNKEALQVNGNMGRYSELVQTLSFHMSSYVNLTTTKQDTIPTADFILNRTYGLSNVTSLLFVFSRQKIGDSEWVQFNLNEFGLGIGNQRFRFSKKDLDDAPEIDFERIYKR